ncbi:PDZ domain-containing protein [Mycobacterium sp. KBS0706]|uniref:trypsin-like peptidase domain-containing protein n=1 Tax=Mycobacterium sp. KBS0706 TaxID=2578109 RepID=UPI00110F95CC|nr:trypsin-like peptidase domain-containing protein [Mycobacterium sp. KBS0706]TSD85714.1 PDZ domain-containing protein [Mycobacterium sp. KBS0706]
MKSPFESEGRRPGLRRMTAALLVGTALIGAPVAAVLAFGAPAVAQSQPPATTPVVPAAPLVPATSGSFAGLAHQVMPGVVNVSITGHQGPAQVADRDGGPRGRRGGQEIHGAGSGFIIDPAGYIVTNNHVVKDADEISVTLNDGTVLPAKVVGTDPKTDLALIKVKADKPLAAVEWGNSDAAQVGDWVMAVGNPYGLGGTVTAGIVSARGRDINANPLEDFLQIDAPINPGNSGGPSFDAAGKVIGINSEIYSPSGGSVGIGFAIPSNLAKSVIAQLREHGSVQRGWLGVEIQALTPELAEAAGIDTAKGALVAEVQKNSPALKAGLRQGDVIVSFDGKPVAESKDLPRLVAETASGTSVPVEVLRDGKSKTLSVDIALQPKADKAES